MCSCLSRVDVCLQTVTEGHGVRHMHKQLVRKERGEKTCAGDSLAIVRRLEPNTCDGICYRWFASSPSHSSVSHAAASRQLGRGRGTGGDRVFNFSAAAAQTSLDEPSEHTGRGHLQNQVSPIHYSAG